MMKLYGIPSPEKAAIMYWNQGGATVNQDAGLDAAYLARELDTAVLAIDRPGTGIYTVDADITQAITTNYMEAIANPTHMGLKWLGGVGITRIVQSGRSAGGLGAVASTLAAEKLQAEDPTLPKVIGVYGADTLAWQSRTGSTDQERIKNGTQDHLDYDKMQKQLLELDKRSPEKERKFVHPEKPGLSFLKSLERFAKIGVYFKPDSAHNGAMWATDIGYQYALVIAREHPHIAAQFDFAELSKVTDTDTFSETFRTLYWGRYEHSVVDHTPEPAPFSTLKVPGTLHASFDKRSFFLSRLKPFIAAATKYSDSLTS